MRLFVLGAATRFGRALCARAFAYGHELTAFAGDRREVVAMGAAMTRCHAVVSIVPRALGDAIAPIVHAMERARVPRLVVVTCGRVAPRERAKAVWLLRASPLDWTIVHAPSRRASDVARILARLGRV